MHHRGGLVGGEGVDVCGVARAPYLRAAKALLDTREAACFGGLATSMSQMYRLPRYLGEGEGDLEEAVRVIVDPDTCA